MAKVKDLETTTIRLDSPTRKELERVAELGGVSSSDVIRMCVKHGLPIVEHGFRQMSALLEEKLPTKGKR